MRFGYVPTPFSIYRGIHKLPPGSLLHVTRGTRTGTVRLLGRPVGRGSGLAARSGMDERDALERLETLLADAVSGRWFPTCRWEPSCPAASTVRW